VNDMKKQLSPRVRNRRSSSGGSSLYVNVPMPMKPFNNAATMRRPRTFTVYICATLILMVLGQSLLNFAFQYRMTVSIKRGLAKEDDKRESEGELVEATRNFKTREKELEEINAKLKERIDNQAKLVYHYVFVPFRTRRANLKMFEGYMTPYFGNYDQSKNRFRIIVVEQGDYELFNRGKLINIGVKYALSLEEEISEESCLTIHDVDMFPFPGVDYTTCEEPRHLAYRLQRYNFKMFYKEFFGGVTCMSFAHYQRMNGFSNKYEGWGGEDDNLFDRALASKAIKNAGVYYHRNEHGSENRMLTYHGDLDPRAPQNEENIQLLEAFKKDNRSYTKDGLSTCDFTITRKKVYETSMTRYGRHHSLKVHFISANWTRGITKAGKLDLEKEKKAVQDREKTDKESEQIFLKQAEIAEKQNKRLANVMKTHAPETHVVIVVPFREGVTILHLFLDYMVLYLGQYGKKYVFHMVIARQLGRYALNRGFLANIALDYAGKLDGVSDDTCAITHNVDIVPYPGVDYITCEFPRSLAMFVQSEAFARAKDPESFRGVSLLKMSSWKAVNGFSNTLAAWPESENKDLFTRCVESGEIKDPNAWVTNGGQSGELKYFTLSSKKIYPSPSAEGSSPITNMESDGLNTIEKAGYSLSKEMYVLKRTRFGKTFSLNIHELNITF